MRPHLFHPGPAGLPSAPPAAADHRAEGPGSSGLELWGGLECTVARVGDSFRDQAMETGHRERLGDLDLIAGLGIRTLRCPVIWETIAPDEPGRSDWRWHDERLARLRDLGITPVAGLCHHGSGPRYTDLLDPGFPELLADHARAVAERYPWVTLYTPVNEPVTTARFSALYGHWYPHARNEGAFLRALLNQCKATVLAMRAIRRVVPEARLVQTDDLGKTFATAPLAYQAEYENDRRWLTFDLLTGLVGPDHPFRSRFLDAGVPEADLALLLEADAAPDIVGINHYLTSERFLDHRLERYPAHLAGGNGHQAYADVEAVRVDLPAREIGPAARLREVWERYRRPIAVTEAHHGCTRDEQLRWLVEVWAAAGQVRREGADIRAVTAWGLFGMVDWNTLLTQANRVYEPGAFDVRGGGPRPTALAHAVAALAADGEFRHPVLDRPGWWKREARFYAPPRGSRPSRPAPSRPRAILIADAGEALGEALARVCAVRGLDHVLLSRTGMDASRAPALLEGPERPWAVVHTAGHHRDEHGDREVRAALRHQQLAAGLAAACGTGGVPMLAFSTDLVFAGRRGRALVEADAPDAETAAGLLDLGAEERVRALFPAALVVRTGPTFGPWDGANFARRMLKRLRSGRLLTPGPGIVSPTYLPDLAHAALDLLIDGTEGVWHLAAPDPVSWADLARDIAARAGFGAEAVRTRESAAEPVNTALASTRGTLLRPLSCALDRFFHESESTIAREPVPTVAAE